MKHINALRDENDGKMREIFDKFEIVQQKLIDFESDGADKFGEAKEVESVNESEFGDEMAEEPDSVPYKNHTESEDAMNQFSEAQVQGVNMTTSSYQNSDRVHADQLSDDRPPQRGFTSHTPSKVSEIGLDIAGDGLRGSKVI